MFEKDPSRDELMGASAGSCLAPTRLLADRFGAFYETESINAFGDVDIAHLFLAVQDYGAVVIRSREPADGKSYEAFGNRFAPMMEHLDRESIPQYGLEGCPNISVLKHNTDSLSAYSGACIFHHDGLGHGSGHTPIDPSFSLLMAAAMPTAGGSTLIADSRAAYDWLSEGLKRFVDAATVISEMSPTLVSSEAGEGRARASEFEHALVRENPVSQRRSLIITNRTVCIQGWSRAESRPILEYLQRHATEATLALRHAWEVGDILLWDDRWVKHAGAKDVLQPSERELWRMVATLDMTTGTYLVTNPGSPDTQ